MKGIIIAGGLGTRMRPLTYMRPKPLVPLVNRPFLEYQVALLKRHGVDDIVFATNYMADHIEAHFGDGSRFGVRMRYAVEENPLGTGGAIRNAAKRFSGETVVVFNGDILTDFDLGAVIQFHQSRAATMERDGPFLATITLAPVPSPHPFGVLRLTDDGRVQAWCEPSEEAKKLLAARQVQVICQSEAGTASPDLINAGFYVLAPGALAAIPAGMPSSIEREVFPSLIVTGAVYGCAPTGSWMDLGRPAQLLEATRALLNGSMKTDLPLSRIAASAAISADATVDQASVVGRYCRIEAGARVDCSILHDRVVVGRGATLRNVIVDEGVFVGDNETVDGSKDVGATVVTG